MKILIDKQGNVHFKGVNDGKLELKTAGDVIFHSEFSPQYQLLKQGGGIFDEVTACVDVEKELKE